MRDVTIDPEAMRMPVRAGAALVVFALAVTSFARLTEVGTHRLQPVTAAVSKDLVFVDQTDGSVLAIEAGNAAEQRSSDPKTDGFIRVALTSIKRDRIAAAVSQDLPLRVMRDTNGRLWLEDPATSRRMSVDAFGPVNARAFAKLLDDRRSTP